MILIYQNNFKRLFDVVISLISIVFLFPLFLVISLSIKLESKGSVLFKQKRVGKDLSEFKIYKFRTMLTFEESYNEDGSEMENYERITKVGNLLRKTSLDELPQLINILKGEMSLVGPRPTLSYQAKKYNNYQMQRLKVKPGITGLAQVNGRNSLTWEEKIDYDIVYIDNLSFILDCKIILKTFFVLLKTDKVRFEKHDEISKHEGDTMDDVNE